MGRNECYTTTNTHSCVQDYKRDIIEHSIRQYAAAFLRQFVKDLLTLLDIVLNLSEYSFRKPSKYHGVLETTCAYSYYEIFAKSPLPLNRTTYLVAWLWQWDSGLLWCLYGTKKSTVREEQLTAINHHDTVSAHTFESHLVDLEKLKTPNSRYMPKMKIYKRNYSINQVKLEVTVSLLVYHC